MRRSNKSMRKQLKALLMTVALVTLSTGLIGCNNEKKQQQTTTQVETTENKVENNIEFKSDGEPVKGDSVLGKNTYVFSPIHRFWDLEFCLQILILINYGLMQIGCFTMLPAISGEVQRIFR